MAPLPRYWSGFDVAINVLGYMPLGFLWALALSGARRSPRLFAIVIAALLSWVMEALQTYLAPRVASNVDWGLNTLGAMLGVGFAWAAEALGVMRGWQRWREGRFDAGSGFALGLLVLWPLALLALVLIEIADLVTEMTLIKHPFDQGILAQRGIDF